jgi:cytochrome c553
VRKRSPGRWALLTALFVTLAAHGQVEERVRVCAGCHGTDGNSSVAGVPSIAAQPRVFLENYLVLTREGLRGTEVMQQLLKGVADADIVQLARHYAALPSRPVPGARDKRLFAHGRQLAGRNRCGSCHTPSFRGQEQMPRLAGQREEFLLEAMRAYRDNRRAGGDTIMAAALYGLSDADLQALAHFLAHQP